MLNLLLVDMLLIHLFIRVFLSNLRHHSRHQRANRVLTLFVREETVRILSKVILLKVILIVHALLELVTTLVNDLLAVLLICCLGYFLIFDLLLLLMNVLG
jgi:hypothetical protein